MENGAVYVPIQDYITPEYSRQALESYVAACGWPTAIIGADPVLLGITRCLYDHRLRVPEDVSLVGLDDSIAYAFTPPLTSSAFPVAEIAYSTVQLLTEDKKTDSLPRTIHLSTYLIERSSVAPPKKK